MKTCITNAFVGLAPLIGKLRKIKPNQISISSVAFC